MCTIGHTNMQADERDNDGAYCAPSFLFMAESLLASVSQFTGNSNGGSLGDPFRSHTFTLTQANGLDDDYQWTRITEKISMIYFTLTLSAPVEITDESLLTDLSLLIYDEVNWGDTICSVNQFSESIPNGSELGSGFMWRKYVFEGNTDGEYYEVITPYTINNAFTIRNLSQIHVKAAASYHPFSLISTRLDFYKLF